EGAPFANQDGGADAIVAIDLLDDSEQRGAHGPRQGIDRRIVDGDPRHAGPDGDGHRAHPTYASVSLDAGSARSSMTLKWCLPSAWMPRMLAPSPVQIFTSKSFCRTNSGLSSLP